MAVPMLLLALPAGLLADRFERRRLVMLSTAGVVCASLALGVLSLVQAPVAWLYVALGLGAAAGVLGRPARLAMLPQVVPSKMFASAVTWRTSVFQVSTVIGPAAGGLICAWSISAAYFTSAAGAVVLLCCLALMDVRSRVVQSGPSLSPLASLAQGFAFLGRTRLLLVIMALDMFAVLLGGAVYLLPVFAADILGVRAAGLGLLRAAPGAGALCMALLLAHLPPMKHAGRNLPLAVAGFGAATIVFGFSTSFWLSMAMLFLTGAFDNVSVVVRHTLVLMLTPDEMRGRVSAVKSVFIGSSNELGGLESGVVAHYFGPVVSVVSGGIGTILVVCAAAGLVPSLRRLGPIDEARPTDQPQCPEINSPQNSA
jgi:MFS family permease